jgi:hypothetical protein
MNRSIIIPASLFALLALSGPSAAKLALPCEDSAAGEPKLLCYCQPGSAPGSPGCRCVKVATDESGVEVY